MGLHLALGANSVSTNVAVGAGALSLATASGNSNTAIGYQAMFGNKSGGINNTAIGYQAMFNSTTGSRNFALGASTLSYIKTGNDNIALGYNTLSGYSGTGSALSDNVAIGNNSFANNINGSSNVGLGYYAGAYATTSNNFYVGNINQSTAANDQNYSLLYGNFAGVAATTTGQFVNVGGTLKIAAGAAIPSCLEMNDQASSSVVDYVYFSSQVMVATTTKPSFCN